MALLVLRKVYKRLHHSHTTPSRIHKLVIAPRNSSSSSPNFITTLQSNCEEKLYRMRAIKASKMLKKPKHLGTLPLDPQGYIRASQNRDQQKCLDEVLICA